MRKLLRLQIRNLFKQKFFYIILVLLIVMNPGFTFLFSFRSASFAEYTVMSEFVDLLSYEMSIVSIIFIALFTCLDFNEGTTKNIIARGYTRKQLLFSKYIVALFGLFSMYIISFVVIYAMFGVNGLGYQSGMGYTLINSAGNIIANTILYVTLSFILEKNGAAIIASLFVPSVVSMGLGLIESKINFEISNYWISGVGAKFALDPTLSNLLFAVAGYAIYTVIFVIVGVVLTKKKEIK